MKILKYALIALAGLLVVAGGLVAWVAATFNPNAYKPQLIEAVKAKTQRTLRLDGDIALSFWPSIGAKIGKASLSERGSEKEFARIEEAHVSLKLVPLLSRQVVVDTVRIKGLTATLVKAKDGSSNVDDLGGAPDKGAPAAREPGFAVDVAGVEIEKATVTYVDQAAGTRYVLSNLDLKSGRLAPGVPAKIDLDLRAQSEKPKVDLQAALKTQLTFVPGKSVSLQGLDLNAKGAAAGIANLALKATGSAAADMPSGEFTADQLKVALTGQSGKDALDVRIDVPKLRLAADKASGDKVSVVASLSGPDGSTRASLTVPGVEGTSQAFRSAAAHLDLDVKRGELTYQAKMTSPLAGNAKAKQLSLPQLKASIHATGPDLPGKTIAGELEGSASVDGSKESAQAKLAGKIGGSRVQAQVSIADFSPLAVNFNLDADEFDADRFLQAKGGAPAAGKGKAERKEPEKPFDLSGLRNLRANGKIHFGSLKANNLKFSNLHLDLKANGGRVDVSPLTAGFYQGTLASALTINAQPAVPTFAVRHNMTGINVGAFLKDLADSDTLEGKGNVTLDVTTHGNTMTAMKKAIDGKAGLKIVNGAIKGIDIAGTVRGARAKLGALRGEHTQPADKRQKTDFSELSASFDIKNGVAHNNDLAMKSPLLRAGGEGDINIGEDTINYLLKASIVGSLKGQGGRGVEDLKDLTVPVRLTGPIDSPSYKLDFGAIATESAKQRVNEEIQKRLGGGAAAGASGTGAKKGEKDGAKSGGSTRDVLKGILGR